MAVIASAVFEKVKSVFGYGSSYKMLLLGETGSGKTSFLNLLCNCNKVKYLCGKYDEKTVAKFRQYHDIKLEDSETRQMQSKTSGAKIYKGDLSSIIDTPGFGDSRGLKQDEENVQSIISCLKAESYINCVCLVINGRQARMSATLKYVLTEITAILPRKVLDNLIVVFTNTSNPLFSTFDPLELQTFFGKQVCNLFYIENPYCHFEKAKIMQNQLSDEKIAASLQKSFEDTAEVLDEMWSTIKSFEEVYTNQFVELFDKKQEIERSVLTLLTSYDNQKKVEENIKQAEEEVQAALRRKDLNANFSYIQTLYVNVVIETDRHNTLCGVPNCYSNCHTPCHLDKSFEKEVIKHCQCMDGEDFCSYCGHHYTKHYHNEAKFETQERTEELIDEEMKEEFEAAKNDKQRAILIMKKLVAKREVSEKQREELSEKLLHKIEEFHRLGINRNYAKLIETQLDIISLRLDGTQGKETKYLRKTKETLELTLEVVRCTLQKPFTSSEDMGKWACGLLKLDPSQPLTTKEVETAFRKLSIVEHPDKGGQDDYYKRIVRARDIMNEHLSN